MEFHGNSEIPGNSGSRESREFPGIPECEFPVALVLSSDMIADRVGPTYSLKKTDYR